MRAVKWIIPGIIAVIAGAIWIHSATSQRPPVVRETLQEIAEGKGLSTKEVRGNPELQQQIRKEIEARRSDPALREEIRGKLVEQKRREAENPKQEAGYAVIAKNNLFKPLGSGDEKPGPSYAFQITKHLEDGSYRAVVLEFAGNRLHEVKQGDRLGNYVVELIEERHVKLSGSEDSLELYGSELEFVGGGGGGGGGPHGGGPGGPGGPPPNVGKSPGGNRAAQAAAMRKEMKGQPPEEVQRMMEQRMREFRERGGGNRSGRGGPRAERIQMR